jgi:hypothetical protein
LWCDAVEATAALNNVPRGKTAWLSVSKVDTNVDDFVQLRRQVQQDAASAASAAKTQQPASEPTVTTIGGGPGAVRSRVDSVASSSSVGATATVENLRSFTPLAARNSIVAVDIANPALEVAALKIQASFRGHRVRVKLMCRVVVVVVVVVGCLFGLDSTAFLPTGPKPYF